MPKSNKDDDHFKPETVPFDPRFPNSNQTLACFINYVDYYRCVDLLEDDPRCNLLKKFFTAMCPNDWVARWDEQRNNGNFPHPIVKVPKDYCEQMKQKREQGCRKN